MDATETPAYLIGRLKVKSHGEYAQRYGLPVVKVLDQYGAQVLVASADAEAIEGDWDSNWTVVLRFPSRARAEQFYASEDYAAFRALRLSKLTDPGGALALVDGFDPAVLVGSG